METTAEVGGDGRGGGEVRRVHIVYFLSHLGRIEHPHLIRVHHINRSGIHLRDVKRWLTELRGKNMPDSYSWSYKRKYKAGYVWQDLIDDDLITPISDNEYVLKGSEIPTVTFDGCTCGKQFRTETKPEQALTKESKEDQKTLSTSSSTNSKASQTDEDSGPLDSATSPSTEESFKTSAVFTPETLSYLKNNTSATEIEEVNEELLQKCCLNKEAEKDDKSREGAKPFTKKKSRVFRNLLNCGATETKDAAVIMVNKSPTAQICRYETLGGSERVFSRASWNQQQTQYARNSFSGTKSSKTTNEFGNNNKVSDAYKPVREPHCSQCGKGFKPEKLHAHMKSCKGLKTFGTDRAASSIEKMSPTNISTEAFLKKQTHVAC